MIGSGVTSRWSVLAAIAVLLALGGCGQGAGGTAAGGGIIDWTSFVRLGGITYLEHSYAYNGSVGRPLTDQDLGAAFGTVAFTLAGNVTDPAYRAQDGDAAFLPAGTPLYVVRGYRPEFRLAAYRRGRLTLFEADANPAARTAGGLLDIGGQVAAIGVNSEQDGSMRLAIITNPAEVARLVDLILRAPIGQATGQRSGPRYFLAFHLRDGTATVRPFLVDSGELWRGIALPPEFGAVIASAVGAAPASATPARGP